MPTDDRLAIVLGTWHAALLLVSFVLVSHAFGAAGTLVAEVGLWVGLALFAWLWSLAVLAARSVLLVEPDRRVVAGAGAGAVAGAAFVGGAGAVAVLWAAVSEGPAALMGLPFLLIGMVVAMPVGVVVGVFLVGVDVLVGGTHGRALTNDDAPDQRLDRP